jgi:hypothetical protein
VLGIKLAAGEQIAERATISGWVPRADLEHSAIFQCNAHDAMTFDGSVLDSSSGTTTIASWSSLYTRSPTRSDAIGRSPSGVAIGVSGAAQIGHCPPHCHRPSVQVIVKVQSGPQDAPGALHGVPACGITGGQSPAGLAHTMDCRLSCTRVKHTARR